MELVIMAAGLGNRFGGLKQITPVGPNGEFILDYSIYDAIAAGFDKVIFVIKENMYEDFRNTVGNRIADKIQVAYAFQDIKDIPEGTSLPVDRTKPLGTGHALYAARNVVTGDFGVISADDFYGRDAFFELAKALKETNDYCLVGYKVGSTMTENGSVKRGICFTEGNKLQKIVESKIEKIDGVIHSESLENGEKYILEENHLVSMLMYGLRKDIFPFIDKDIPLFFKNAKDLNTDEYFLPTILDHLMEEGKEIKVLPTTSKWKGVTYANDLEDLKKYIKNLIEKGEYPEKLWQQ